LLSLFKKIFFYSLDKVNRITPKNKNIISIITYPDFDDTAKNLVIDAIGKDIEVFILLTGESNQKKPSWAKNTVCVKKYSLKGMLYFIKSGYVLFTHNYYPYISLAKNQTVVNFWHGMPIKDIGKMDNNSIVPVANYSIASCEYFKEYLCKAFDMPIENITEIAHPRLKSFIKPDRKIRNVFAKKNEMLGIWLPTYRYTKLSGGRSDGDVNLDVVGIIDIDYEALDLFLINENIVIYIKPHPMNFQQVSEKAKVCRNIRFIGDNYLLDNNTSLYELMALSDFLITDVSSVYFDYKLLNKKIIIAFCDKLKYINSRCGGGRSFDDIVTEKNVNTQQELMAEILSISDLNNNDFEYMKYWGMDDVKKNTFDQLSKLK